MATFDRNIPTEEHGDLVLPQPLPAVCIDVADPDDWTELISELRALGFPLTTGQDAQTDGLLVRITDDSSARAKEGIPFVVVARSRSVDALIAAMEAGASGYFSTPIDYLCLSVTLRAAAAQAQDLAKLSERTAKLNESLNADQSVGTVVGILMERYRFERAEAYERLRRYSRTERRKVVEVATEILNAREQLTQKLRAIETIAREP